MNSKIKFLIAGTLVLFLSSCVSTKQFNDVKNKMTQENE